MIYDIDVKYTAEFMRESGMDSLEELLITAQQRFLELRHQCSPHGRVKFAPKPHLFKKVKKDIARFKTILREN